ncbi:flagellar assembly protein FliX [Denitrobaculum tricleocarpae]|uniref:Flagellar assembly protein FliX n=1 Tax=Denitrobaculum tricleocarpae TaxID=2591009 RepID=A0A545T237_9PROT|nr:flagellar assembly protein FliX [Denitrobaculum tricleocarpae]TQV71280.1 flagellar assembly protein FliX [Denitrobaculum tricleocarpae]
MKIGHVSSPRTSATKRSERSGSAKAGGFAQALGSGKSAPAGLESAAPLGALDALVALQEVDDPTTGRAKAQQRGEDLLDRLDQLRMGLLLGRVSVSELERLSTLVNRETAATADPRLREILSEIELRAAVELAKLGQ